MEIKIKRVDKTLPLPEYKSKGAAAFDLYSRIDMKIAPQALGFIPTNLIVQSPRNHVLIIAPRSSTPKRGLLVPHGIGIIDEDYSGDHDEILLQVFNYTKRPVLIQRGERIGQAMFVKLSRAKTWLERDSMNKKSRGGFGSTG